MLRNLCVGFCMCPVATLVNRLLANVGVSASMTVAEIAIPKIAFWCPKGTDTRVPGSICSAWFAA